jgi:hypothetical protein
VSPLSETASPEPSEGKNQASSFRGRMARRPRQPRPPRTQAAARARLFARLPTRARPRPPSPAGAPPLPGAASSR